MARRIGFFFICLSIGVLCSRCVDSPAPVGQDAEYDRAMTILMHEPTEELFPGVIHPDAALFSDYFSIDKAAEEHANYRRELKRFGANVLTVREILLQGTLDKDGNPMEGRALDSLRRFAAEFLTYNTDSIPGETEAQARYKRMIISRANPKDLVRIIMLQPEIVLSRTDTNTGFTATYIEHPIMNIFFMRDQMISTAAGIVIGKMNSPQRETECRIAEFCLEKIGLTPIHKISGENAFLEGGDFLPFGNVAFIGRGLRTTQEAIDQLMDNDLLGCDTLVVVKDRWLSQEQMHLDTYFNIIDRDLVTLSENRYLAPTDSLQYLSVDVYARDDNTYRKVAESEDFVQYLEEGLRVKIIPISRQDELTYANNFLTVAPRHIMAVAGQSQALQDTLMANGVRVTWIPLTNLIKGYGAAHCMTQVLGRDELF